MTERVECGFTASRHGFHFQNRFSNGPVAGGGRCGGMAFAGLDYYRAGLPIPLCRTSDFAPGEVPPDGTPLADLAWNRLMDSFGAAGVTFADWCAAFDDDVGKWTREQAKALKTMLKSGPVALGLVATGWMDLAGSHQVVACGYEQDGNTLRVRIWDNNLPDDDDVWLVLDTSTHGAVVEETTWLQTDGTPYRPIWRGFFVESYTPRIPAYSDVTLVGPVRAPAALRWGEAFEIRYTLENAGVYPATGTYGATWRTGGSTFDAVAGSTGEITLAAGERREIVLPCTMPGHSGQHVIGAAWIAADGISTRLRPYQGSGAADATIGVRPAPAVVPEVRVVRQVVRPRPSGIVEGAYEVELTARCSELASPIAVSWAVDPGTPGALTASGAKVTLVVPVGGSPGPWRFDHPATVAASAPDGSASAAFTLHLPSDQRLEPRYDAPESVRTGGAQVGRFGVHGNRLTASQRTFYSRVRVAMAGGGVFPPCSAVQAYPTPVQVLADGSAVFDMPVLSPPQALGDGFGPSPYGALQVSMVGRDAAGQWISLTQRILPYTLSEWSFELPIEVRKFLPPGWIWVVDWKEPVIKVGKVVVRATPETLTVGKQAIAVAPRRGSKVVVLAPAETAPDEARAVMRAEGRAFAPPATASAVRVVRVTRAGRAVAVGPRKRRR